MEIQREMGLILNYIQKTQAPKIYLAGDLHLNHKNIIRYCNRPFKSVKHMNHTLIRNWNKIIRNRDKVYFLGDLCLKGNANYWRKKLKGRITFINGNHDDRLNENKQDYKIIAYKDIDFLLIHNPYNIQKDWEGWSICGHTHNNSPKKYPLINHKNKTVNVSIEMINYKPIELETIYQKIRRGERLKDERT